MNTSSAPHRRPIARAGFTLVEILTVIVIIGILAGIAIPAISTAVGRARSTAIKLEVGAIAQGVEQYREKYGDYPPDFSDWEVVERHFRRAFPRISPNELRILSQFTFVNASGQRISSGTGTAADPRTLAAFSHHPHAIDRAEALVFCLGGFSKDIQRPFTGPGGPLTLRSEITNDTYSTGIANFDDYLDYQYNTDRETGFAEIPTTKLTVTVFAASSGPISSSTTPYAYSTNDVATAVKRNALPDPFPAYLPSNNDLPLAYFDARTYDSAFGINYPVAASAPVWYASHEIESTNCYIPSANIAETGVARPMALNVVSTSPPASIVNFAVSGDVFEFANKDTFQLICAGSDGHFGGVFNSGSAAVGAAQAGVSMYPTGTYYNPFSAPSVSSIGKYQDDTAAGTNAYTFDPQLDNLTNFSESTLGDDLP